MKSVDDFVHLNTHSDYTLQRSIAPIPDMVKYAAELGQRAIALTDEGNLFGAVEFTRACEEHGIAPIIGCELRLAENHAVESVPNYPLVVLCKNKDGFFNLKQLSSAGYIDGFYYIPRVDIELVAKHAKGLICIIPQYANEISHFFDLGQVNKADAYMARLKDIFGYDLYVELQNHGQTGEYRYNAQISELAARFGVRTVAGNDCHYVRKADAFAHGVFIANVKLNRREFHSDEYYVKSRADMEVFFKDYPDALNTTLEIAEQCGAVMDFPGPQLPDFSIPENFTGEMDYLRHLVFKGLAARYPAVTPEIKQRAEYELSIMDSMGFSGYFLIVWDIIAFAHKQNIPVGLGRGSAAGSIVAYALGITGLDPLKYGLLFERFLNPERISMPDIDTDFCVNKRQDVINYIRRRYGETQVGQIITFSLLKPRGAVRDVARAMDIPVEEANSIAKLLPFGVKSIDEAKQQEPKLGAFTEDKHNQLFSITEKILGVHRHASLHAAGVVIGKRPLIEYVPLYKDPKSGAIATQYTMDYLEDCGLVKMDVLGLRTVTVIAETEKMIRKQRPDFSIDTLPEDDEDTFKMLSEGKSDGVFQFESPGMRRALRQVQPSKIGDLIALNALYRPGPMKHIETYAEVKHGRREAEYHLNTLKDILEETYGVIVYQEQVMEIAQRIAGYSLGAADILRRAMGKKKKKEMEQQLDLFVEGAVKQGYEKQTALNIFKLLEPFAEYGFNKSHAAAYGVLAYQTAYLKQHYPKEFMVCQLNAIASRPDEVTKHLYMCRDMSISIVPPDVNHSAFEFSVEGNAIRCGLNAVKTMPEDIKRHIPKEREKNGPYTSVVQVIERLADMRGLKQFLDAGIPAGLFDSIDNRRALLFANCDFLAQEGRARFEAKQDNRVLLFSGGDETDALSIEYPVQEEDTSVFWLEREYVGMYLTRHPLEDVKEIWQTETTLDLSALDWEMTSPDSGGRFTRRKNHYLVCYIDEVKFNIREEYKIFSGRAEDFRGEIQFVYRTKSLDKKEVEERRVRVLVGSVAQREERFVFWVDKIIDDITQAHKIRIEDARSAPVVKPKTFAELHIDLSERVDKNGLQTLQKRFVSNFGKSTVVLHVRDNGDAKTVALPKGLTVDAENEQWRTELKRLPYVENIWCV